MTTTTTNPNEIRIIRIYDAPVKAVWDAWIRSRSSRPMVGSPLASRLSHAQKGFTRRWNMGLHDARARRVRLSECNQKYYEVEKNIPAWFMTMAEATTNRRCSASRSSSPILLKGKTKMDMTMGLASAEALEETRKIIKKASGYSTWDRLSEYLTKTSSGKEQFVINRTFDAPIEKMYEMWTAPKHFSQWLAPTGFTMKFLRAEIKSGGTSFYSMTNGSTMTMYGRASYLKMERPHLISYTQQFCDEKENITRHPLAPTWPETMLTTVELAEEGADKTRVTVTWEAHGKVTPEELDTFVKQKAGMTQGWTGSFDKLETYLTKNQ